MNNMVSIITPCYNASAFIDISVTSVLAQTHKDWELLVVDDCSSDNSAAIIRQFAERDSRIRYLKTDKPSGSPTLPRNIGIENAKGKYISFLDSDDAWLPTKLERQMAMFEKYDDMAICFSNYEKMAESGERNNRIIRAPERVTYKQLLLGNVIGCLTAVYDMEKVGKVYFPNHSHEDYIMWLSILKQGYFARNTGTVEALYRVREHSVSSNKLKALSWQWDIYRNVEQIGLLKSGYYFAHYAYSALRKAMV